MFLNFVFLLKNCPLITGVSEFHRLKTIIEYTSSRSSIKPLKRQRPYYDMDIQTCTGK